MSTITWGILGTATIARVCVIPAIQASRNGRAHAIASRSIDRAQALAAEHNIPHAYDDYEAVLTDPAVDAVYIPLPNHLHHPWTLRALAAGKHVLCEKPLALNATEAQAMADAAQAAQRLLMEGFMYRFHPRSQHIKQLIKAGDIGQPCLIKTAFTFNLSDPNNSRYRPEMGGGALMDTGCYGVSLARWLLEAEPIAVQAHAIYG
ncbi:MAG: Gfo/Idh/MocA family oxidoreductase, partial [Anaerolineae bacterium]|nr:Gfo/Idh/MocA family oxidoreductase [Anaerolineae bacterium]